MKFVIFPVKDSRDSGPAIPARALAYVGGRAVPSAEADPEGWNVYDPRQDHGHTVRRTTSSERAVHGEWFPSYTV